MNIKWNEYTWYSKLLAAIFFIIILPIWTFYIGMQFESVKTLSQYNSVTKITPIISQSTSTISQNVLPPYGFVNYSKYNDPELVITGTLAPVKIEYQYEALKNKDIKVRCWKKTMTCAWGMVDQNATEISAPTVSVLSITEWDKDKIVASGDLASFPDCEKDSCSLNVDLTVDLINENATVGNKTCFDGCAINTYLLVGQSQINDDQDPYSEKSSPSPAIPTPEVKIVPIV